MLKEYEYIYFYNLINRYAYNSFKKLKLRNRETEIKETNLYRSFLNGLYSKMFICRLLLKTFLKKCFLGRVS